MRLSLPFALALLPLAAMTTALAQEDPTVVAVTYIDVTPATRDADATALRQLATASRKEPGVIRYETFQRSAPSNQFAIIEIWKDQKAYDAHAASEPVKGFRAQIEPHLIAPIDERPYVGLAVGPTEGAAIPAAGPVAISHVDVIPPKKDDGIAALKALADPTRKDNGNLRFDVVQYSVRPNHFTVIEQWRDQAALDAHVAAAHTLQYRDEIQPLTGSPLDERVFMAVE